MISYPYISQYSLAFHQYENGAYGRRVVVVVVVVGGDDGVVVVVAVYGAVVAAAVDDYDGSRQLG